MADSDQPTPIFITGRFRSGTTLLWQMFNAVDDCCAYYEPCHDNLKAHLLYTAPMPTHRGVDDYWQSYHDVLDDIESLHSPAFGLTRLILEAEDRYAALETYLRRLIESAGDRRPVLKFNRVDFRLPWLRARFPEATIVHITRDVRETYASMTRHLVHERVDDPGRGNVYDLLEWSCSLSRQWPFLIGSGDTTLYERHYLLWRLSAIMGSRLSDLTINFDKDVQSNDPTVVDRLIEAGCLDAEHRAAMLARIERVPFGGWTLLHDEAWYKEAEKRCDSLLDALGLLEWFGRKPMQAIRADHAASWEAVAADCNPQLIINQMLCAYSEQRSEVTRLLHGLRSKEAAAAVE